MTLIGLPSRALGRGRPGFRVDQFCSQSSRLPSPIPQCFVPGHGIDIGSLVWGFSMPCSGTCTHRPGTETRGDGTSHAWEQTEHSTMNVTAAS
jgi:hypothetical protein